MKPEHNMITDGDGNKALEGSKTVSCYKKNKKQLGLFLLLCLPITWILMGISYALAQGNEDSAIASVLLTISMFMPAVAAIVTSIITKEKIGNLHIFPRFHENGKIYIIAILVGIILSCISELLMMAVFPDVQKLNENALPNMLFMVMLFTVMGVMQSFLLLGEEIGWMGYLFPKLEKLYGTTLALIFTGLVRGAWHVVMFLQSEEIMIGVRDFLLLCISNILLGSVLVLLTKMSKSVVPAAITHSLTNSVPIAIAGFMIVDENLYETYEMAIRLVDMLPGLVIGIVCYVILMRKFKSLNFR